MKIESHKRMSFLTLTLSLALLLQGCTPVQQPRPTLAPVTLKVQTLPYLSFAPYFIALEEGYFAEQGLEIEFVKFDKAAKAIPALIQGEVDVVAGNISIALLNAIAQGSNIKFVADKSYIAATSCDYHALLARKALLDSGGLDSQAEVEGLRAVINPTSFESFFTEKVLSLSGLALTNPQVMDVPVELMAEAFEKGTIDIAFTSEPWLTRILQAGHAVMWMPQRELLPELQAGVVLYGPNLLEKNPDVGRGFMIAYLKAVRQYNEGKTERNLEILIKHTALDRDLLMQACWPSFRADGKINVQSVLDFQAWAVEKGALDKPVTEKQFWDPSFVEYANRILSE